MDNFIFSKRFMPLFFTQYFGAFNDNFLKNSLVIMVTYQMAFSAGEIGGISNLASALFILPYFVFSAFAGMVADKYDCATCAKVVKIVEILLMTAVMFGFFFKSLYILLIILALMGTQSTFFGPVKYALLPKLLKKEELLRGNAWIEGGTYLAILTGAIAGSILIGIPHGAIVCGLVLIFWAVVGFVASCHIPSVPAADSSLKLDWNIFRQLWQVLVHNVWKYPDVRYCILSVTMFWTAGSLYIAQTPVLVKQILGCDEKICTLLFVLFSVGVGCGAALAGKLFRNCKKFLDWRIIAAIVFMGLFTWDLALIANGPEVEGVVSFSDAFGCFKFYHVAVVYFFIAVCGGMWSVPVQTRLQASSPQNILARVIAGNNIVNAIGMAGGSLLAAYFLHIGFGIGFIFFLTGAGILLSLPLTIYLVRH